MKACAQPSRCMPDYATALLHIAYASFSITLNFTSPCGIASRLPVHWRLARPPYAVETSLKEEYDAKSTRSLWCAGAGSTGSATSAGTANGASGGGEAGKHLRAGSLFAAVGSLIVTAITAFAFQRVIIYFALLGVYGVYAGLRGIFTAFRVPKLQGLITSIIGLILSIAAIIFTVWLFTPE